ncbi:MAG: gliding motility-associated C-terminal domain-containing protein [Bacteroidia bacterium]
MNLTGSSIPAGCNLADGIVMVSVTGGVPGYTYQWDTLSVDSEALVNVPAGIYTVIVTDTNNCTSQLAITVSNSAIPPPTIAVVSPILCHGDTNASVQISAAGGTPPFTFTWDGNTVAGGLVTNIAPGTYNAGVEDSAGCVAFTPVTISEPTALTATFVTNHPSCFGDSSGTAVFQASGGTFPYTYQWSPIGGTDTIATDLPAGIYTVQVTDNNGCTTSASVTVIETNQIQILVNSTVNATCFGGADGSVDITASGTQPLTFNWNNGYAFTEDLTNVDANVYTVVVTDAAGCTETAQTTVSQPPALPIDAGGDTSLCAGNSMALNATLIGNTTGTWSSTQGVTFSNTSDPHATASNLATGNNVLTWTVTDGTCQTSITINVFNYVTLAASAGPDIQVCGLNPTQLNGNVLPGTTGFWTGGGVTFSNASLYNSDVTAGAYGNYILTWTITNNACINSDSLNMTVDEPVSADAGDFQTLCVPQGQLDASVPVLGSGLWTFQTASTAVLSDSTNHATDISSLATGSTILLWTVTNGSCTASDTVSVFYDNACDIELPTGFSPNGDLANDGYNIHGIEGYPLNIFRVFNRWGNEVYTKENYKNEDWVGQNNSGEELPEGTYYVILEIKTTSVKKNTYVDLRRFTGK